MSDEIRAAIILGEAQVYAAEFARPGNRRHDCTDAHKRAQAAAAQFTRWIEMRHSLKID